MKRERKTDHSIITHPSHPSSQCPIKKQLAQPYPNRDDEKAEQTTNELGAREILDTNDIFRYLTRDDEEKAEACYQLSSRPAGERKS